MSFKHSVNPSRVRVFVTRYWATKGILVGEAEIDGTWACIQSGLERHYFGDKDWHWSHAEAQGHVRYLKEARHKGLEKQLKDLQKKYERAMENPTPFPTSRT